MGAELKPGQVVRIKSGGPKMTIQEIDEYMGWSGLAAKCQWFDGAELKSSIFELHSLELVD